MIINYGYGGSSIDIIKEDKQNNTATVSPVMEDEKYSNYYNFRINNKSNNPGTIIIKNINNQQYDSFQYPLILGEDGMLIDMDNNTCYMDGDDMYIHVRPMTNIEISSYPRYTIENLKQFLSTINNNNDVTISKGVLHEIVIGNPSKDAIFIIGRQHPGETLSSFFIEGMIKSILDNRLYDNNCFVIYPIVNQKGVLNGNHRYTNKKDYNRLWHTTGVIPEIDYIKSMMDKYNIVNFIDVHCDEITKKDYIRTKITDLKDKIDGIQVLEDQSNFKRFARALVKQRKIINVFDKKAREYVEQTYKCNSMLIELSLHNRNTVERTKLGYNFISKYMGVEMNEDYTNTRKK